MKLHQGAAGTRLGYVLKVFPRVSETFVINEIRALANLGDTPAIFSLHHNDTPVPHGVLAELRGQPFYVDDSPPDEAAIAAVRRALARHFGVVDDVQMATLLPRKYVRLALRLAELARQQGVGHLHAHFASRAGHVAALAAPLAGCSYSFTAHAKDIYHRDVDATLLRWKIAQAKLVVTVTDYNRAHLLRLAGDLPDASEKIVRLYNGVDLARFQPAPLASLVRPRLLGIGRLVEKKGFRVLVEACRLLRQQGHDFECVIIGGGPDEAVLGEQITAAGLGQTVRLAGVLPTEVVAIELPQALAVVLPCVVAADGNVDALPTVLLEAAAAARPGVSTHLSGIPEIIVHDQTGLLVRPGDAAGLAEALATLLRQPALAARLGVQARARAEELFDLHANVAVLRGWLRGIAPAQAAA
jgi:glycosyltransferase involved in cell wall biosynthesis